MTGKLEWKVERQKLKEITAGRDGRILVAVGVVIGLIAYMALRKLK